MSFSEMESFGTKCRGWEKWDGGPNLANSSLYNLSERQLMAKKKKQGLYANIHKAQERAKKGGKPVRKKGSKGAPSEKDFAKSAKTAKKTSKKKTSKKKSARRSK